MPTWEKQKEKIEREPQFLQRNTTYIIDTTVDLNERKVKGSYGDRTMTEVTTDKGKICLSNNQFLDLCRKLDQLKTIIGKDKMTVQTDDKGKVLTW